nr:RxLR effector protein PSR2 [Phytophthora ramorum]
MNQSWAKSEQIAYISTLSGSFNLKHVGDNISLRKGVQYSSHLPSCSRAIGALVLRAMRFYCVTLLVLVALVAISSVASTAANSKATASNFARSVFHSPNDAVAQRLLRTDKAGDAAEEERAISVAGVKSGLTKTKTWLQSKWAWIKAKWAGRKLVKQWQKEEKTPDDTFTALKLNNKEEVDTLLANPKLDTWLKYLTIYNKKNPTEMKTMLGVFTKFYGNEAVARMLELGRRNPKTLKRASLLQDEQLVGWRMNGLSQDIVFQLLKLDKNLDTFFSNPNAVVWNYYFFRGNVHNTNANTDLIKTLTTVYGDDAVARAIEAAKKVKGPQNLPVKVMSPQALAKKFETAQFKQWMIDGKDPAAAYRMLTTNKETFDANVEVYKAYRTFYKENKK